MVTRGIVDRLLNDVVVGDNIAVLGQYKAGTAGGGGGGLAKDVHRGVYRDADAWMAGWRHIAVQASWAGRCWC